MTNNKHCFLRIDIFSETACSIVVVQWTSKTRLGWSFRSLSIAQLTHNVTVADCSAINSKIFCLPVLFPMTQRTFFFFKLTKRTVLSFACISSSSIFLPIYAHFFIVCSSCLCRFLKLLVTFNSCVFHFYWLYSSLHRFNAVSLETFSQ